jgi:hypothetical protein
MTVTEFFETVESSGRVENCGHVDKVQTAVLKFNEVAQEL